MLELEVIPQQGLQSEIGWEFLLGMHFSHAVAIIQSQIGIIKTANVVYSDQTPLNHDLILDLPQDGFRLIFDSKVQRLKIIEVYNMKLVRLKYCNTPFNSPGVSPSVEQIDRCFGATRPGSYDKQRQVFALNFRGLIFYFPVDLKYEPHYSHGLGSLRFGEATPVLSKMIIYNGHNLLDSPVCPPCLPDSCFKGQTYTDECTVIRNASATRTLGLRLRLVGLTKNIIDPIKISFDREILFGEGVQSVVAKLGTPARIFFKSDDKMKIHSKEAHKRFQSTKSDYFFNYLTLGLDILFDSQSNEVIKFVLHTNFPGHYDFNSYHRCPFRLRIGRLSPPSTCVSSSPIIPTKQLQSQPQQPQQLLPQPISANNPSLGGNKLNPKSPKVKKNKGNNHVNNNNNNNTTNSHNNMNNCANNTPASPQSMIEDIAGNHGGVGENKEKTSATGQQQQNNLQNSKTTTTMNGDKNISSAVSNGLETTSGCSIMDGNNSSCNNFIEISYDSHWEEVNDFACENHDKVERPVVLTRSSSKSLCSPTLCYPVQDMIFEVLQNDHIGSLILFQHRNP